MLKRWIFVFVAMLGMQACLFDSAKPGLKVALPSGVKPIYEGGLFKVIGTIPQGARVESIIWRSGSGRMHHHGLNIKDGLVQADTAYVEWQKLPLPSLDTIKSKDSTVKPRIDTSYYDTLSMSVDGAESPPLALRLVNFLPNLDSAVVNGVTQYLPGDLLELGSHRGEVQRISLKFKDQFNTQYGPRIVIPDQSQMRLVSSSDSVIVLEWQAPTLLMNDTVEIRISDARGLGQKTYKIHRFTYNESGTVWLGAGNRYYKISDQGQVIYQSPAIYGEIVDFAIHPTRNSVWFVDALKRQVVRLNRDGAVIKSDSGFIQPSALGLDVVSNLLQVADQDATVKGRLRSYDVSGLDSSKLTATLDQSLLGPIGSINIDQYDATLTWYTVPEMDLVLKVRGTKKDTLKLKKPSDSTIIQINRPTYVAYDAGASKIWISDSTSLILADTNGFVMARVYGFNYIGGIAATQGQACVLDSRQNKLYRLKSNLLSLRTNVNDVATVSSGMAKPVAVDISYGDLSCWVVDRDAGSLLHFAADGSLIQRLSGFKLPSTLRVHKGVE